MNKKLKLLIYVMVFICIIVVATFGYNILENRYEKEIIDDNSNEQTNISKNTNKTKAKDFIIYDSDGNKVTLEDLEGKPIIINFWTTWCTYCVEEMPEFNEAYNQLKEDITFIMLNVPDGVTETKENVEDFIINYGFDFSVYYDTDFSATKAYSLRGYPMTLFIDSEGYLIKYHTGMLTKKELFNNIELIK